MIYSFTYWFNDRVLKHTCYNEKEADLFFKILLSLRCNSIRIDTKIKHSA